MYKESQLFLTFLDDLPDIEKIAERESFAMNVNTISLANVTG
jgi:hypothetical protein